MATKICPRCNGTGRIEVEKMDLQRVRNFLKDHIKLHANHGLGNLDKKTVVEGCFRSILKLANLALEELEKEGPEPPDPPPPPPSKPKLAIKDGILSYGSQRKFFGASSRPALTNTEDPEGDGWEHPTLSNREVFDWYQGELAKHPFNIVRCNIGKNFKLLERHCEEMERQGKVHILTMADLDSDGMGDWREAFERTKRFSNILYNAYNEFTERGLNIAVGITDYIQDRGRLVSCGAWMGNSGKKLSKEYLKRCKPDVLSHHRTWDFSYMEELVDAGWIVIWDESFRLTPSKVESNMRAAEKVGVVGSVFYPFREDFVGSDRYKPYFEITGKLCQEFNQ